jgi:hypothetical protein
MRPAEDVGGGDELVAAGVAHKVDDLAGGLRCFMPPAALGNDTPRSRVRAFPFAFR